MQAARYRERHGESGAKSDPGDVHVLAELMRPDRAHHRPIAGDSDIAEHLKVLARAHQGLIWSRQRQVNTLRSMLREFHPAALVAFDDLAGRDALAVLAAAPSPEQGRRLTPARVVTLLRRSGRQRNLQTTADNIVAALRSEPLAARPAVVGAYAASTAALIAVITSSSTQVNVLTEHVGESFGRHPDAEIYLSQPSLGQILGARVLAEFDDDPHRYADARARRNYSGMSPITKTSGQSRGVIARYVRNRRLSDALYQQAFAALTASPGASAFYDAHRARATPTTKHCASWATNSPGSCTVASATTSPTTRAPPGQRNKPGTVSETVFPARHAEPAWPAGKVPG